MHGAFKNNSEPTPHQRAEKNAADLKRLLHNYVFDVNAPVPSISEVHLRKNSEGFDWCVHLCATQPEQQQRLSKLFDSLKGTSGIALAVEDEKSTRYDFYFNNDVVERAKQSLEKLSVPKAACKLEMHVK